MGEKSSTFEDWIKEGVKTNFVDLINNIKICVPTIQRDYIQGRTDKKTKDISSNLIKDLVNKTCAGDKCNLNFTVGVVSTDDTVFLLDGQQRITTLFLLYFFVAYKAEKIDHFIELVGYGETSSRRFTYNTRYTTQRFFDAMVLNSKLYNTERKISENIKKSNWYSPDYNDDISVKSAIAVLEMIEDYSDGKDYALMFNNIYSKKCLTFFFLLDDKVKNPHEHYIKINSRGKSLTDYELFKSSFYEEMGKMLSNRIVTEDVIEKIKTHLDDDWYEFFWSLFSDEQVAGKKTDELIRKFIHTLFTTIELSYAQADKVEDMEKRYDNLLYSYKYDEEYSQEYCLCFLSVMHLLIRLKTDKKEYFDYYVKPLILSESDTIVIDGHINKICLYAISQYAKNADIENEPIDDVVRFIVPIRNIVVNDDSINTIKDVYQKCSNVQMIDNKYLKEFDRNLVNELSSFNNELMEEELEKQHIIQNEQNAGHSIFEAERSLPFFNGRIAFLLRLSAKHDGSFDTIKFERMSKRARYFSSDNYHRVISFLLTQTDYSNEFSIGSNGIYTLGYNDTRHYAYHWRNLFNQRFDLFKDALQKLLDSEISVDTVIDGERETFLNNSTSLDFRTTIIKYPQLLEEYMSVSYSKYGRYWMKNTDDIYLMKNSQRAAYTHYKLLCLYETLKEQKIECEIFQNDEAWYNTPKTDLSKVTVGGKQIYYSCDDGCFCKDTEMKNHYLDTEGNAIASIEGMARVIVGTA